MWLSWDGGEGVGRRLEVWCGWVWRRGRGWDGGGEFGVVGFGGGEGGGTAVGNWAGVVWLGWAAREGVGAH
jgi:hypothetical protein